MSDYFLESFRWMANEGCGVKNGLAEFRRNWQLPLRSVFPERVYRTEVFLFQGEWASCFGYIDSVQAGPFMEARRLESGFRFTIRISGRSGTAGSPTIG